MVQFDDEGFAPQAYFYLIILLSFVFLIIAGRLCYLQVVKGERYLARSESNFIQEVPITHSRGLILDRNGKVLVDNRPSHDVFITYGMLPKVKQELRKLRAFVDLSRFEIKDLSLQIENKQDKQKVLIKTQLNSKICKHIEQALLRQELRGVVVEHVRKKFCSVYVDPRHFPSSYSVFHQLQKLLKVSDSEMAILANLAKDRSRHIGYFKPVPFVRDVEFELYARLESAIALGGIPGVAVLDSKRRRYIHGAFATHALGFMNEVSLKELKKSEAGTYRSGDRVGRRGVEASYEGFLRGRDGVEKFVVDAKGRRYKDDWQGMFLAGEGVVSAKSGHNVILSIDYDLQKVAEESFRGRTGSTVALDIHTGEVLALASFPDYDANLIIARNNKKILKELSQNRDRPWVNKVVQEFYAPGSTLKPITAMAGLSQNAISSNSKELCTGEYKIGRTKWRCFRRHGHGHVNLEDALKMSCDSYFYELASKIGQEALAETSRLFGLGGLTEIDLGQEVRGLVPDKKYYAERFGYYAPGFVVNNAIGQGDMSVTPIQLAVAYATLVNGGKVLKPQVVREVVSVSGDVIKPFEILPKYELEQVTSQYADIVSQALGSVMKKGGSAYGLRWRQDYPDMAKFIRQSDLEIGGKTGTAQVVKLSKKIKHLKVEEVAYLERDHAWFVGFAPAKKPEIVVVTMVEHGGYGGVAAAPVSAEVIRAWYTKNKNNSGSDYAAVK